MLTNPLAILRATFWSSKARNRLCSKMLVYYDRSYRECRDRTVRFRIF